jgi:hypothetical protein
MREDISLAGFMLTAEEWAALDPSSRAQLVAAATRREDGWMISPVSGIVCEGSGPQRDDQR